MKQQENSEIIYLGNSDVFEFESKKTGRKYVWRNKREAEKGGFPSALVLPEDVEELKKVRGRGIDFGDGVQRIFIEKKG